MSHRILQLNSLIQQELSRAFLTEVFLNRHALTTITKVETSRDLDHAKIWVSVLPFEKGQNILKTLQKNAGRLQSFLNARLVLRKIPRLKFVLDATELKADRINRLLNAEFPKGV
ncbi:MAG: 30S ribosome-binding factor RbfA [Patescibacteria group bacterium]|nr:30S ribosome-binding factor RbfA [Patescibacteria group bacterium]